MTGAPPAAGGRWHQDGSCFPLAANVNGAAGASSGSSKQSRRHIFAGLHRRNADEVATASKNGLAAEGHDVLALFDEDGSRGPLDFVAFAKSGERDDVFGQACIVALRSAQSP